MEDTTPATEAAGPAEALEQAVDEAIAEAPTPKGFFSLNVHWREGTTEAEIAEAMPWVTESAEQLADSPEDLFPHCVIGFTVKRD